MSRTHTVATILMMSVALAACSKKKPESLPPEPGLPTQETTSPGDDLANGAAIPGSQADFIASVASDTITFDTDRYNIDSADAGVLQSQAQWLARFPAKRAIVEGHADERGTRDYNLALGERRANAAKTYLVGLGFDASRIQTVSYGKERPVEMGSDEGAWALNRLAVTVTVQ